MNIETHVTLHYALDLLFYMIGQILLVICTAYLALRSTMPNAVLSMKSYFLQRWPPLVLRWFISLCLFFLVWHNPAVFNLERFMPTVAAHFGMSGLLGWVSDSMLDKVLAIILPGINKALPPVPTP